MFQSIVIPLIGTVVLLGWLVPVAWALRPAQTRQADALVADGPGGASPSAADAPTQQHSSLAGAKVARALTRNGLLGVPLAILTAFLVARLLFDLPGWFQLAWVVGILLAGYAIWRCALLWPSAGREEDLRSVVTAHGMRPVGLPWAMIVTALVVLAVWFLPPLVF
ncbi:hypothetical protein [Brevibacterium jeotgali]|uniref:Uncharacterized protein n=1 Tax=Brevibacterium jeotgali TaxID=1262550 RepID=A0A2H1L3N9_9MICO|nr:hypothetical protein [Brevibacterium jeotgali]TWC01772.1 hypothetical protein FB108_0426 [Brevibacterium jeotgali]SMY11517.1 hypothetical protein BJEO58_01102 [Brevibacterium jeotgali]